VHARVLALRSEGFGGDFRSGYEDAFELIMDLMEPPKTTRKGTINLIGARMGPSLTEFSDDLDEIIRLLHEVGVKVNAVIAGGCTVDEIRRAREVELNASWCYDWGQKLGDAMETRFGIRTVGLDNPTGSKRQRNGSWGSRTAGYDKGGHTGNKARDGTRSA